MARKKSAKGLFEIIGPGAIKSARPLGVPGWFGQAKRPAAPPSPPPPAAEEKVPPRAQLRVPAKAPAPPEERVLSASGGRVRISLNQLSTVVVIAGVIGLIILAFVLGRRSGLGATAAAGDVGTRLNQGATTQRHVTPHPPAGPTSQAVPAGAMVPDSYRRPMGLYYLVIQDLVWTRQEAEDIKQFLYSRGINATMERMGRTRTYRIRDTKGFKSDRSQEAKEHKAQVERLGREYKRRGRYDFFGAWFKPEP